MILKENRILEIEPNPFTRGGINVFYIISKSKAGYQYQLRVDDHQAYPGFKFVWCNCIGIVKTLLIWNCFDKVVNNYFV